MVLLSSNMCHILVFELTNAKEWEFNSLIEFFNILLLIASKDKLLLYAYNWNHQHLVKSLKNVIDTSDKNIFSYCEQSATKLLLHACMGIVDNA